MTSSINPHGGVSSVWRRKFAFALVVLLACAALLASGCKKNANTGNGNSTGLTSETPSQGNIDMSSAEVIKGMANEQGQATQPDNGNFTVEYSEVRNPEYT